MGAVTMLYAMNPVMTMATIASVNHSALVNLYHFMSMMSEFSKDFGRFHLCRIQLHDTFIPRRRLMCHCQIALARRPKRLRRIQPSALT